MPDLWGGEQPIDDDLLAQLLEGEEQPIDRVHEIPFSRSSPRPRPSPPQMARSKSLGKKRPDFENSPNSPAQPDSQARVPLTSGRENAAPDPRIQVRARPRHQNLPDVEWYLSPTSQVTPRMLANYRRKYPLIGVNLTIPAPDQRANLPGGPTLWPGSQTQKKASSPWSPMKI